MKPSSIKKKSSEVFPEFPGLRLQNLVSERVVLGVNQDSPVTLEDAKFTDEVLSSVRLTNSEIFRFGSIATCGKIGTILMLCIPQKTNENMK